MHLRPAAAILALAYECISLVDAEGRRVDGRRFRRRGRRHVVDSTRLVTELRQDAEFHRAIISNPGNGNSKGLASSTTDRGNARRHSNLAEGKECDPKVSSSSQVDELPDVGILLTLETSESSSSDCPEQYACVPNEASQLGGMCVHNAVASGGSTERNLQSRDFCECIDYGYAIEEEECFDTAVAGCAAEQLPPCVDPYDPDQAPYIAAFCDYYVCLSETYGSFFEAIVENDNTDACYCEYYASVCSQCEEGLASGVFCDEAEAYCDIARCCETSDATTCFGGGLLDGESLEPTAEGPTGEPSLEVLEPTASPVVPDIGMPTTSGQVTTTDAPATAPPTVPVSTNTIAPTVVLETSTPEPTMKGNESSPSTPRSAVTAVAAALVFAAYAAASFISS